MLTSYFESSDSTIENGDYLFRLIVSSKFGITEAVPVTPGVEGPQVGQLKVAIFAHQRVWEPARQNGYKVCAYIMLKVQATENIFRIEVLRPFQPRSDH